MHGRRLTQWALMFGVALLVGGPLVAADGSAVRKQAREAYQENNPKDAYELFAKLCLDAKTDPKRVGEDLAMAIQCLHRLNRHAEFDPFVEKVIAVHKDNWRLLLAAANQYQHARHYGYLIAGEFQRGHHRGGGKYANAQERDRVRALQLMATALPLVKAEADGREAARFYIHFANMLCYGRNQHQAWRLQYRTDLAALPDYEDGHYHHRSGAQGAPVDEDGAPVFHRLPATFAAAQTDGERWRWCLTEAMERDADRAPEARYLFASFLYQQFGVQTLARYGRLLAGPEDEDEVETGTYALHTLSEEETLARLATGVQRFSLPDEFNYLRLFQGLAADGRGYADNAISTLASLFENRRQYEKAAAWWRRYRPHNKTMAENRIRQITGNWGTFEPVMTQPAGQGATVEYRFRNGRGATFKARAIRVRQLLDDIKAYIESRPERLDRNKIRIEQIGRRLVYENEKKYLGEEVARWSVKLAPRPRHFDRRITIDTPLQNAGAYLVEAAMEAGNTSRIILWLDDSVIVKKALDQQVLYYVADTLTGAPVAKANVEFFGYRQEWQRGTRKHLIRTKRFAEHTDENGLLLLGQKDLPSQFQYLAIATAPGNRLAILGFSRVWYPTWHDQQYHATKALVITDRPVYRPGHTVQWKVWLRQARYDQGETSTSAGQPFKITLFDPKGDKVHEKTYTADAWGGIQGDLKLPDDAPLGVYRVNAPYGGGTFRVEEYKKPEFEVTVEAPADPVRLGEVITGTVKAKYYFGAPVTEATVKLKVLRHEHTQEWFPVMPWDWFYGPGYWWFAYDYDWYPGWQRWGCLRPAPWWWHRGSPQPEVVLEQEVEIGADGTVSFDIDTTLAKEVHGDTDHRYEVTAAVRDASRRTIVGTGKVLVARKPFKVYAWVDRGHYRVGDTIHARFQTQTLDRKPVRGTGELKLLRLRYKADGTPVETPVQSWSLDPDAAGRAAQQIKASLAGQYRLSFTVDDGAGHRMEGGYIFVVRGDGFDGRGFRFNAIELVPDRKEYGPGDTVDLLVNTERPGSTVLLFERPANGVCRTPRVLRLGGKSLRHALQVSRKDMPNFFLEALTVSDGKVHVATREIIVPPESRVLGVEVLPEAERLKPGASAAVKLKLTDSEGKPFTGSTVVTVYDKAVEYIAGGSNVPEIKAHFWKWRRRHTPRTEHSLNRWFRNLLMKNERTMADLGVFGHLVADEDDARRDSGLVANDVVMLKSARRKRGAALPAAPAAEGRETASLAIGGMAELDEAQAAPGKPQGTGAAAAAEVQPTVRKNFADTAFWRATLNTDKNGVATVEVPMPEQLTTWKIKAWAMGHGTKVGQGETEIITTKDLLIRMQAPRFFVEKDEVVLSANIHNYLEAEKQVRAVLELDGDTIAPLATLARPQDGIWKLTKTASVPADGEARVDWRVRVVKEGEAVIRMQALTDEESDAMEKTFPVLVHGAAKLVPACGVIRPEKQEGTVTLDVPQARRVSASRLGVRYSPTLALAMIDALPYLVEYPYGCTEQTLNRFLPTVITQNVLRRLGVDLAAVREKTANLNAQELGDSKERAAQWRKRDTRRDAEGNRVPRNPVFNEAEVTRMVKKGVEDLTNMQLADGGWGWFSGYGERSTPHTTAVVVHGLLVAQANDVALVPGMLERGVTWLANHQTGEVRKLSNWHADPKQRQKPYKAHASNLDALVYSVLAEAGREEDKTMREFLFRDRSHLSVYGLCAFGLGLEHHRQAEAPQTEHLSAVMKNISQFLVQDEENQTAWLKLGNGSTWWYWYGSETEAQAWYLKLLCATDPKGDLAPRLVKYLLNNRKHATYWRSTRDTAYCIEAFADYLAASGETEPDLTVTILVDGKPAKEVAITKENLFTFDNTFVLEGDAVETGKHTITLRKEGTGPLYFNSYLSYFSLEDFITKAGLEVKVERRLFKLQRVAKAVKVAGSRGQALDQAVEKYDRVRLENDGVLKSGDLVEVELVIHAKNDYEYLVFEDRKAAGCEPVEVRSGYTGNEMGAYVEFRDDRVSFFVRRLARGTHSVSYRLRAEIPGRFSALPARGYAMYAPELKGNSDEIKLRIED